MNPLTAKLNSFSMGHFVVAGVLIGALVHFMKLSDHSEAKEKLDLAQNQLTVVQDQLKKGQTLSQEQPKYEKEITETKEVLETATELIPENHSQREIIEILSQKGKIAGVRMPVLKPGAPTGKAGANYSSLTYDLELQGTYTQISNFFFELTKAKNILQVGDFALVRKEGGDRGAVLDCRADVFAFAYSKKVGAGVPTGN